MLVPVHPCACEGFQYAPNLVTMVNAQGEILYQNQACMEALGIHARLMNVVGSEGDDRLKGFSYLTELFDTDEVLFFQGLLFLL